MFYVLNQVIFYVGTIFAVGLKMNIAMNLLAAYHLLELFINETKVALVPTRKPLLLDI